MRLCNAYMIVIDISGYTRFITERSLTLEHAEQIVSDLLDAVLDQSRHPLTLNKLEGDAALMYAEIDAGDAEAARELLAQVRAFFPAFRQRIEQLSAMRRNCSCDACRNITALSLKAFVHCGEILLKKVRQFDELAGEPVILLHRLMKNSVPSNEYVLLTDAAVGQAALAETDMRSHEENVEGMGAQRVWLVDAERLPAGRRSPVAAIANRDAARTSSEFRNLPDLDRPTGLLGRWQAWWKSRAT